MPTRRHAGRGKPLSVVEFVKGGPEAIGVGPFGRRETLEPLGDLDETFFAGNGGEGRVPLGPLSRFRGDCGPELVGRVLHRLPRLGIADVHQIVEVAEGVTGLPVRNRPEQRGNLGPALDIGLLGEEAVAERGPGLGRERLGQAPGGLRTVEIGHGHELYRRPRRSWPRLVEKGGGGRRAGPAPGSGRALATLSSVQNLDWTVVRTAATAALILIVPGALVATYLLDGATTAWAWLFFAMIVAGFVLAGYVGGRLQPDTPMIHGAIGALLACVVALVLGALIVIRRGDDLVPAAILIALLSSAASGVAGALLSDLVHRMQRRRTAPTADPDPA